jgi:recombination DNA repair RAD52 pathway protein
MLNKLEFLMPLLIGKFQFDPNDEKNLARTREPAQRIVKTIIDLRAQKNYKLTEQVANEVEKILNKCADDLEKVVQTIRPKNTPLVSANKQT